MSTDLRKYINLGEELTEASLRDVVGAAGDAIGASLGNDKAKGNFDRFKLTQFLHKRLNKWLGQVDLTATPNSVAKFLTDKIQFTARQAGDIFTASKVKLETAEDDDRNLNRTEVEALMKAAAVYAFKHDLIPDSEKSADDKDIKLGNSSGNSSSNTSGRSQRTPSQKKEDPIKDLRDEDKARSVHSIDKAEFSSLLTKNGLTNEYIGDLTHIVSRLKAYDELKSRPDSGQLKDQLARIGYAFFKSLK